MQEAKIDNAPTVEEIRCMRYILCFLLLVAPIFLCACSQASSPKLYKALSPKSYNERCKANWLYRGQIGVSTHYFATQPEERNKLANAFDVKRVADQAERAGASWFLLTIHQQPWIMMAPNQTYDRLIGTNEYTATRDLPLALSDELEPKNIRLMLYVNLRLDPRSASPQKVRQAMGGWPPNDKLIANIAAVYREFSLRYGKRVSGWWVDGAWMPDYAKSPHRETWFKTIGDALRAGNPDAVVAFNSGVGVRRYSDADDYTAGETDELLPNNTGRWLDGIQWHEWTYLSRWWSSNGLRFDDVKLGQYISQVTQNSGAITFEVGTRGITKSDRDAKAITNGSLGIIDPMQVEQLHRVLRFRRKSSLDSLECAQH